MREIETFSEIQVTTDNTWHTVIGENVILTGCFSLGFKNPSDRHIVYDVAYGPIGREETIIRNALVQPDIKSWTFCHYTTGKRRLAIRARYRKPPNDNDGPETLTFTAQAKMA